MALKAIHDKLDEIPEEFQSLYTEKGGKFELTGIQGVKSQADIDRLNTSLASERAEHKTTKDRLGAWGELKHAEVVVQLDRIPELEAAAKGNLDEAAIEEIVSRRVEGTITSKLAPVERQLATVTKERDGFADENKGFRAGNTRRTIHDTVRKALTSQKVIPEAHEDALFLAERVFEVTDEGVVQTRDNVGVPPGLDPSGWLGEIQPNRPHWWQESKGGGARGSGGGGGFGGKNPFSAEHWNMTEQGKIVKEKGTEHADRMAKAAGTTVGGMRPKAK